ncbi:hypothetical protein JND45_15190, partial [Listeria monocytogenes]|uniref:FAD-linked oxidase C-terminal domain-containing protein n=1 Tax=Listeria monocytogenes TaxID=1639 RepID=UPI001A90E094
MLFADVTAATRAVIALQPVPVSAVELMDRASLRAVDGEHGIPGGLAELGPDAAALLVETRAETREELDQHLAAIDAALAGHDMIAPMRFET